MNGLLKMNQTLHETAETRKKSFSIGWVTLKKNSSSCEPEIKIFRVWPKVTRFLLKPETWH